MLWCCSLNELPLAYPASGNRASYRQQPEHFQVNETLNFDPSDEGDHLYLYIKKINTNTDWLARDLAHKANLNPVDVGYAGRKDRFAVTKQWFSLHLPVTRKIDLGVFNDQQYQLIEHRRHHKKLRKGAIDFNHFILILSNFQGSFQTLLERVELLNISGFPNYFGPQRFGHAGANIENARNMLSGKVRVKDRNKRSIYLSAARSFLFNKTLAKRVGNGSWLVPIKGDIYWDSQTKRIIDDEHCAGEIAELIRNNRWIITAALPGDGENNAIYDTGKLEAEVLNTEQSLYKGIQDSRVKWQRRSLKVMPKNLSCRELGHHVELEFSLPTGAYATSLLRELITVK